ncbi:MAG: ABC transporter [Lysobacteraceae bacterium]|nr:MAG: ABC transporter [Xanthomonadaceae bacterium]
MSDFAFRLSHVSRQFTHFKLQDIDLELERGGVMGLIGPNGAGKSTVIRILMGLMAADQGQIEVLGQPIPQAQALAKRDIGFASEDLRLYKNMTLSWHMRFVESIFPEQWDQLYADKLLKSFDLIKEQKIKGMSHGQRVKASLLLILARHPGFLILDEPTTGLDPVARKEVLNELMLVLADDERSILFSSHNTQDVEQLSDLITFIDRGVIVNSQDKESFIEDWRRVRLTTDQAIEVNGRIREVIQHGHTATLTVQHFGDDLLHDLTASGATIQGVEHMNLEEVFVAEVEAKRSGAPS